MLLIKKLAMVVVSLLLVVASSSEEEHIDSSDYVENIIYNGFNGASSDFSLSDSVAEMTTTGVLRLTNNLDGIDQIGHAFYSHPLRFMRNSWEENRRVFSFSCSFIFSMVPESPNLHGQGITFVIAPKENGKQLPESDLSGFYESYDLRNGGISVELNDVRKEAQGHHIQIRIDYHKSAVSEPFRLNDTDNNDNNGSYRNLSLISGELIRVWINYDGASLILSVTIAPLSDPKPGSPLFSSIHDLSHHFLDSMYVGFSSSTRSVNTSHYIFGWSFMINNGTALPINVSQLPELPENPSQFPAKEQKTKRAKFLGVQLPIIIPVLGITFTVGILFLLRIIRNCKLEDVVEDWEQNYWRLRFSYKDLYIATKGFTEKELLGIGGFGKVYKGVLPTSKTKVAVKRISHNSKQGVREFISEIISIGHLRHRNLAHLLGYCRRNRELLLVYNYMPNGSLDKLIFRKSNTTSASPMLGWNQRFEIIKGVACALIYLHEDWEQVVVHRDIKSSNVLLDGEMNARLSDFGLARLYDRGTNPKTTNVAGTFGYIAPEMIRTGKATTSSDVYAFGALLLEVACGRRPTELHESESEEGEILVDWVLSCWRRGAILQTSDPNLGNQYIKEEMELVLKLGLLCSHSDAKARPRMRQVMQYLEEELPLPQTELWALDYNSTMTNSFGEHRICMESVSLLNNISSVADSLLSGPR